jgi:hypothetical protein
LHDNRRNGDHLLCKEQIIHILGGAVTVTETRNSIRVEMSIVYNKRFTVQRADNSHPRLCRNRRWGWRVRPLRCVCLWLG